MECKFCKTPINKRAGTKYCTVEHWRMDRNKFAGESTEEYLRRKKLVKS